MSWRIFTKNFSVGYCNFCLKSSRIFKTNFVGFFQTFSGFFPNFFRIFSKLFPNFFWIFSGFFPDFFHFFWKKVGIGRKRSGKRSEKIHPRWKKSGFFLDLFRSFSRFFPKFFRQKIFINPNSLSTSSF